MNVNTKTKQFGYSLTRYAKRNCSIHKMGPNASSKRIDRTLDSNHLGRDETEVSILDVKKLNQYFTAIGPVISSKDSNQIISPILKSIRMVLQRIDELELTKKLMQMKNKSGFGHDYITNEMMNYCSSSIEKNFAITFNNCFKVKKFPQFLKIANAVPIFFLRNEIKLTVRTTGKLASFFQSVNILKKLVHLHMVKFFFRNNFFSAMQQCAEQPCFHAICTVTDYMPDVFDKIVRTVVI